MKSRLLLSLGVMTIIFSGGFAGEGLHLERGDFDNDKNQDVRIDNGIVEVVIAPANGGAIVSLKYAGMQLTRRTGIGQVLSWDERQHRSNYFRKPFVVSIDRQDDRIQVRLGRTGESGRFKFLEMSKTITVFRGRAAIRVDLQIHNQVRSQGTMSFRPWFHNFLGAPGRNSYFAPTTQGIVRKAYDPAQKSGDQWFHEPARGWIGCIGESGVGAVVTFDYPETHCLYNWCGRDVGATAEWRFVPVEIPCGKDYRTSFWLTPFKGLSRIDGAGTGLAAELALNQSATGGAVVLVADMPRQAHVKIEMITDGNGSSQGIVEKAVALHAGKTARVAFRLSQKPCPGAVLRCIITGPRGKYIADLQRLLAKPDNGRVYVYNPRRKRRRIEARKFQWDWKPSMSVITPHLKLACPVSGPLVRAAFLLPYQNSRDLVEIAQRVTIQPTYLLATPKLWGAPWINPIGMPYNKHQIAEVINKRAMADLPRKLATANPDVLLMGEYFRRRYIRLIPLSWKTLPEPARRAITAQVQAGMGLVMVNPTGLDGAMQQAFATAKPLAADDPVILGFPFDHFKGHTYGRPSAAKIKVGMLGKGRVMFMLWRAQGLLPFVKHWDLADEAYEEPLYSLVARCMLWAAGREFSINSLVRREQALVLGLKEASPAQVRLTVWTGRREIEYRKTIVAQPRSNRLQVPLPHDLPAGEHFALIQLLDAGNRVMDWMLTTFTVKHRVKLAKFTIDRKAYVGRQPIIAHVEVTGPDRQACVVNLVCRDNFGRCLARTTRKLRIENSMAAADMVLVLRDPVTALHFVGAELAVQGKVTARRSLRCYFPQAMQQRRYFRFIEWGGAPMPGFHYTRMLERMRDLGIREAHSGTMVRLTQHSPFQAEANVRIELTNINRMVVRDFGFLHKYQQSHDKKLLVRKRCLHDPGFIRQIKDKFRVAAQATKDFGPRLYYLGDEMSLMSEGGHYAMDICFGPHTLSAFRLYLKQKYRTLTRLNQAWGSAFKAWDKVMPLTAEEALATGRYGSWLAHRAFMERAYAEMFRLARDTIRTCNPQAMIGEEGVGSFPIAYDGNDWFLKMQYCDTVLFYDNGDIPLSFVDRRKGVFGRWCLGYYRCEVQQQYALWRSMVHGHNAPAHFALQNLIQPDLSDAFTTRFLRRYIKELNRGIGEALGQAAYEYSPIAIHYSRASCHLSYLRGKSSGVEVDRIFTENVKRWNQALRSAGFVPRFMATPQIEARLLRQRKVRVLILPLSLVLTDAEVEAISEFVDNGGVIIADSQAGIFDGNGRPRSAGALDSIFGVKRSRKNSIAGQPVTFEGRDGTFTCSVTETGISRTASLAIAAKATPSRFGPITIASPASGITPGISIQSHGRGAGIYLGACRFENSPALRACLMRLLGRYKVYPMAMVRDAKGVSLAADVGAFRSGAIHYFAILPSTELVTGLNLPETTMSQLARHRQRVAITLGAEGRIFAVREHAAVGRGNLVNTDIMPMVAKLYAVVPEEPVLTLTLPGAVARGQPLGFSLRTSLAGSHPVYVEVIDARGRSLEYYAGTRFATQAGFSGILAPIALNAAIGTWTMRITDVITGSRQEQKFEVKQ